MAYLGYNNPGYRKHMAAVEKKKMAEQRRKVMFREACVNTAVICGVVALVITALYIAIIIGVTV